MGVFLIFNGENAFFCTSILNMRYAKAKDILSLGSVKDEMVTWDENGQKVRKRKHYITMTMAEAHAVYASEFVDSAWKRSG